MNEAKKNKKVWKIEEIRSLLEKNEIMVKRSVVEIYNNQTSEEKLTGETKENNGVGFNGVDAYIMSSFARQIIEKNFLSKKQMIIAKKKIKKYARQLTEIANNKEVN
jgi:hypothetical protein